MTTFRVTQQMAYLQALSNLQRNYGRLYGNQRELASGTRVQTASDDPTGTARLLDLARRADDLGTFRSNIATGQSALDNATSELQAILDVSHQARERVLQGLNGTLGDLDRATIANEIDQHLTAMLGYANTQVSGSFQFAGSRTDTVPFVRTTGVDGIERVVYQGDALTNQAAVAPGLSESFNIPGSRLVDVGPRTATLYSGSTGVHAGAGTDSGSGRARLTVGHLITGFGPQPGTLTHGPSGLRTGASSAASDTILGFGHALNVSVNAAGTGGTVSLNGGTLVSFTTSDTNLAVTGPSGEVVHLDFSQVVAGFSGPVQLDSYGSL